MISSPPPPLLQTRGRQDGQIWVVERRECLRDLEGPSKWGSCNKTEASWGGELLARTKSQMPPRGWQPQCHAGQRSLWARTRSGAGWEPEAAGERIRVRAWSGGPWQGNREPLVKGNLEERKPVFWGPPLCLRKSRHGQVVPHLWLGLWLLPCYPPLGGPGIRGA